MKLESIQGKNRIRNFKICKLYLEDNLPPHEIGRQINLSERQVSRVLYKNRDVLISDKMWEKTKRKWWLKSQIVKRGDSKKDSADLLEQLRKEEEEGTVILASQLTNIVKVELHISNDTKTPLAQESGDRISEQSKI